ncbi:stalk domain-containing protein [Paenibacillus wynnii]|uniref:stalk domain-containing protein n=1 Tax=Paenibacillus wynnii TaxID=268407 RepID=UPI00278F3808|nr:stalk domain-containing protein [Paenibacillus wynnii]MDQ0195417.1 hypothetical protein [Paenibacillus wynnii]
MVQFRKARRWITLTLAALLLISSLSLTSSIEVHAAQPGSNTERVVLDPGYGYRSIWEPLANQLYTQSPVISYLPTRLPDSDWQYFAISSKLLEDGYKIEVFKSTLLPSKNSTLPSTSNTPSTPPDSKHALFQISAGNAQTMATSDIFLHQKDKWSFYADQAAGGKVTQKQKLTKAFTNATKFSIPFPGTDGIVTVTGSGADRAYSAYWTFDHKVGYTFESRTSLSDFISMLYSFRPVINLLKSADVVLLPIEDELTLGIGRSQAFQSRENEFISLSTSPTVIDGSVYLPLKDIVQFIKGQMQYVAQENAVYFSENGYYNTLRLQLKTGEVYRKNTKIAQISVKKKSGSTLVPLSFLRDQFGLKLSYNATSKKVTLLYKSWFTNSRIPEKAVKAEATLNVLTTVGPSFNYENSRLGSSGSWGYIEHKPPQGYNGSKYTIEQVTIPLLPGSNEFVYRDNSNGRVINSIPITADISPADIPFNYSGYVLYESLQMKLKLTSKDGQAWPAGYAESSSYVDINGSIQSGGFNFPSLRLTYRKTGSIESKPVSFPITKDGFSYRFKPSEGPGTYLVTLYNPPGSIPKADLAAIVTFTVVIQ